MKRIRYIKPTPNPEVAPEIQAYLQAHAAQDVEIDVVCVSSGPKHLESVYYEALAGPEILRLVREAEAEGIDGVIIGCFYDPVLNAAREICQRMVVTGPAQSAMQLAGMLGRSFSIIIGHDKWRLIMDENVHKHGLQHKLASFRSVGLGVLDFHKDPEDTVVRMRQAVKLAIEEDLAEVIVLGCTMQFGFYKELQASYGVPVIDAMLAALKYAELLAEVRNQSGWYTSKITSFKSPNPQEMLDWGL